jgi:solute carrier family 4 anion exchanger 2
MRNNNSFAGSLDEISSHKEEAYPHNHHVMSRHRPRHHGHHERKFRKISDPADKLPTIEDEEHHEEVETTFRMRTVTEHSEVAFDHEFSAPCEAEPEEDREGKVLFSVGHAGSDEETEIEANAAAASTMEHKKHRKKHHRHHHHRKLSNFSKDELEMRRARGSELAMDIYPDVITDDDDYGELASRDLEDLSHHRFDEMPGYARHMISSRRNTMLNINGPAKSGDDKKKFMAAMYGGDSDEEELKEYDHTPHDLVVEMDELINDEWVEQARWIKYEEAREDGAERWGQAHVSSLSFHSLLNLRLHLERGVILLDLEARDMTNILYRIVEELNVKGLLADEMKGEVLRIMLYKHRYIGGGGGGGTTIASGLNDIRRNLSSRGSFASVHHAGRKSSSKSMGDGKDNLAMEMEEGRTGDMLGISSNSFVDLYKMASSGKARNPIMNRMPEGSEGALTLCGAIPSLTQPMVAFVRLAEGYLMSHALEIPIPLRFVFVILTPKPSPNIDCHEVGRSFSTLMSNPVSLN